ncbi:hypothetical protein VTN96DRAFT_2100 [Rasamsonia emersonii]|uniref:ABM domain-containing protein n=1 Tax=Rasamsonia emersonii (strain ATCC 16479 / CBS 393.64 / IMI 116815) TaxID=1408163 RepID=A0A0F4YIL6_RASE3|nr:hypothetical protein T310_8090 [Rasamsonia emersonii CBS 393.64]KKA17970.1 hypothetical protein T310_8090 [Rasamsonia emersonii CBS 393.64]
MQSKKVIQLIIFPHRPIHADKELDADIDGPLQLLLSAKGLLAAYRGRKFEERFTRVYLLVWDSLASSHGFFTSAAYDKFNTHIQPALKGRKITWTQHAEINASPLSDTQHFDSILSSPAIEVAWTKVVEGKVSGYYEQFDKVVRPILNNEPGCDGFFISPHLENPQNQILLINWKSVDAHHVDFENKDTFKQCIDALYDYYGEFVVPWHIVELKKIFG